jgi:hypothetical protein
MRPLRAQPEPGNVHKLMLVWHPLLLLFLQERWLW